jgi:hypothetical protein
VFVVTGSYAVARAGNPHLEYGEDCMSSIKLNGTLFGLALIFSTPVAHGQQMSNVTAPVASKTDRASKFTATCSQRDLLVTTLIDRHGEDRDIAGDQLREAFFVVMDARAACAKGQEREALALYDSIIRISMPPRATR